MEILITILVIGLVIYLIVKVNNKSKKTVKQFEDKKINIPLEIKISNTTPSTSTDVFQKGKFKPMRQNTNSFWILNPEAPFELTLLNKDKNIALAVRELLDRNESDFYHSTIDVELLVLFLENNIKIKEIEDYKTKYQYQYKTRIDELKAKSKDWTSAYEKDKEDLLVGFREKAIQEIYERLCDDYYYETLFEWEPQDTTLEVKLIKEYGFQNIDTYLRCYSDKTDKIRVIPNDKKQRPIFENLVQLGLAYNGFNLQKDEILNILSLKELNEIAKNHGKEYKRKNQAIEYLMTFDNIEEKIGQKIALRELFKLKSLPDKYSSLNIEYVFKDWEYYNAVIALLRQTYDKSYYTFIELKDNKNVKSYNIEPHYEGYQCKCSQDNKKKKFTKDNPPRIPCHIGCYCQLNKIYDWD